MATAADVIRVNGVASASALVHFRTFDQRRVTHCDRLSGLRHFELALPDLNNQEQ
ncbi:MAG: hypothetical protein ACTHMP_14325 [Thermomicrobiales bacterium]